MKNAFKLLVALVFFFTAGAAVWAQNAQKEIDKMYSDIDNQKRAEQRREDRKQAIRSIVEEIEQKYEEKMDEWNDPVRKIEKVLGSEGLKYFEPILINGALKGIDVFQPNFSKAKFFPEDMYIAYKKKTPMFVDAYPLMQNNETDAVLLPLPNVMKIHDGPSFIVPVVRYVRYNEEQGISYRFEDCVLVDSLYRVFKNVDCDGKHIPYQPLAQKRYEMLKEVGFSDETAQGYALDNPWNLKVYAGCNNFDGHKLVEKVVMAWRYSSIANNTNVFDPPNHEKQVRYVFVRKDGREQEETPKSQDVLPECLDIKGKPRKPLHDSRTQPEPGNYSQTKKGKIRHYESGGCGNRPPSFHMIKVGEKPHKERVLQAEGGWYF